MTTLPLTKPTESRSSKGNIDFFVCLAVSAHNSRKKGRQEHESTERREKRLRERNRKRDIKPKLGEKSGWCPKAIKIVLHVEPTNISEVLNMNPIKPGPEKNEQVRREERKKEMKGGRKEKEKVD